MEDGEASLQALTLARTWGGPLHAVHANAVEPFAPDAIAAILQRSANDLNVSAVFGAGTDRGNDIMARLAARASLPFASNCIAATPGDPVGVVRSRWGGSLLETASLHSPRPLITVAPYSFRVTEGPAPIDVEVKTFIDELDPSDLMVRVSEHVAPPAGGVSLAEAKVVVSGGRGGGSKEGVALIEGRAGLLGGAVGCSRGGTTAARPPHPA